MERARTHITRIVDKSADASVFWCGFVAGQAEKVWLGTCPAAMFRPDSHEWFTRLDQVRDVANEYGLAVTEICPEIWVHRRGFAVGRWLDFDINSPEYHAHRAAACGIPDVDFAYHDRF